VDCSIVGVSDDPTVELDSSSGLGEFHSGAEEDLPGLVVEDDDHEEGEGWDGEVREGNHAGSENGVQERNVAEDSDEGGLEEQREVGVVVDHALLGDGQVPGLANHQIGPLHAHDGHEVTTLSVVEGLNGVADLVLGHVGAVVELGDVVIGGPAALVPLGGFAVSEEETDINSRLTGGEHVND